MKFVDILHTLANRTLVLGTVVLGSLTAYGVYDLVTVRAAFTHLFSLAITFPCLLQNKPHLKKFQDLSEKASTAGDPSVTMSAVPTPAGTDGKEANNE